MNVELLNIGQIRPYWRNPRKNQEAVAVVRKSIEQYGFNQPLVLDRDWVIIAGHARYKALLQLGWEQVPCIVVDLPKDKARAYRIADNKSSEFARWDNDALVSELRAVGDISELQSFFGKVDLGDLLADVAFSVHDVAPADIDKSREHLDRRYSPRMPPTSIPAVCPSCGQEFSLLP